MFFRHGMFNVIQASTLSSLCSSYFSLLKYLLQIFINCCRGHDRILVVFRTTCAINAYHH